MTAILEFRDVARSFARGRRVLDGVTFSMREGEVVGLLGRNGAGKTTLINIAMGLLHPHAGTVRAFGISPTKDPVAVKKRVGYVSEDQILPPNMTLPELAALHRRLFRRWDDALEKQLLERFGLAGNTKKVGRMSKGEARQVALVCAVCHRPELLILDEPAGGLDPATRREFLETSIQLLNREGSAILFSSHQTTDVERLAGRVLLLDGGRVLVDSGMDEIREEHCLAIVPRSAGMEEAALERLPGCLRVRAVYESWHAVFAGAPESVRRQVQTALGITDIQCLRLPLEELFIELVGGERLAGVP
jgi:ABC-2 type transport system ATP-binding protein